MLVNTILVERTLEKHGLWGRLNREDLRALTPLFHTPHPSLWDVRTRFGKPLLLNGGLNRRHRGGEFGISGFLENGPLRERGL